MPTLEATTTKEPTTNRTRCPECGHKLAEPLRRHQAICRECQAIAGYDPTNQPPPPSEFEDKDSYLPDEDEIAATAALIRSGRIQIVNHTVHISPEPAGPRLRNGRPRLVPIRR